MKTTEVKSFADVDTSELKQPIICVFNKPDDYPDKYVARLFEGTAPTNIIITRNTVEEIREDITRRFPDMEILAYYVHFRYVNLKAAPGNKKPYYVFLEDMIEPINLTVVDGKKED